MSNNNNTTITSLHAADRVTKVFCAARFFFPADSERRHQLLIEFSLFSRCHFPSVRLETRCAFYARTGLEHL